MIFSILPAMLAFKAPKDGQAEGSASDVHMVNGEVLAVDPVMGVSLDADKQRFVNGIAVPNTDAPKIEDPKTPIEGAIFGEPIFSLPRTQNVFEARGRKSVCAVEVAVPILSCGLTVNASIWTRVEEKSDGIRIVPDVSMPRGGTVTASDPTDRQRFIDHIAEAASNWPSYDRAMDQAENMLMNGKAKSTNVKAASALAPRLVKRVTLAPAAGTV